MPTTIRLRDTAIPGFLAGRSRRRLLTASRPAPPAGLTISDRPL
ncbi:MAG: hypothetical protein AAFZ07_28195 [Actinomycetota bacterium]